MVESSAYRALAAAAVPTTLVASRGNQVTAFLSAGLATQLPSRRAQHRCADSKDARLALAKDIVRRKLNSYQLPMETLRQMTDCESDIVQFLNRCAQSRERLTAADNLSSILGIEGSMAQLWFVLLSRAIPLDFKFTGRNRRPPRDPVNAMLSLGYTLLHSDIMQAVHAAGMDPSLGFLHADYPGRDSLALDMCEPLRSGVDALVLGLISEQSITPDHFYYRQKTGCRLSKKARPVFFQAWANQRKRWPRPVNPDAKVPWPTAEVAEIANGQLRLLRDLVKHHDHTHENVNATETTFEELEHESA